MFCDIHTHNTNPRFPSLIDVSGNVDFAVCNGTLEAGKKFSAGVHPKSISASSELVSGIRKLAERGLIQAVGECGVDVFSDSSQEEQYQVFRSQALIANEFGLPLIVHCVRLYSLVMRLMKDCRLKVPVVLHGYNGNIQDTRQLLRFGNIYFSFGNIGGNKLRKSIAEIPPERILTESDTDFGKDFAMIVGELSALKNTDMSDLIFANFCRVFGDSAFLN